MSTQGGWGDGFRTQSWFAVQCSQAGAERRGAVPGMPARSGARQAGAERCLAGRRRAVLGRPARSCAWQAGAERCAASRRRAVLGRPAQSNAWQAGAERCLLHAQRVPRLQGIPRPACAAVAGLTTPSVCRGCRANHARHVPRLQGLPRPKCAAAAGLTTRSVCCGCRAYLAQRVGCRADPRLQTGAFLRHGAICWRWAGREQALQGARREKRCCPRPIRVLSASVSLNSVGGERCCPRAASFRSASGPRPLSFPPSISRPPKVAHTP
eukprot:gene8158-biopygen4613